MTLTGAVQLMCPEGLFRCDNGNCIDPNYKCNGKKDCKDGSDESVALCGPIGKTARVNSPFSSFFYYGLIDILFCFLFLFLEC